MAKRADAWPDNAPETTVLDGARWSFYVDRDCILCSVCSDAAPANFRMADAEDHDVCFKQPATADELARCLLAERSCPVEAIGHDPAV